MTLPLRVRGQIAGVVRFYLADSSRLGGEAAASTLARLRELTVEGTAHPTPTEAVPIEMEAIPGRSRTAS